jgi:multidrug efflux pump subunit AcrA (membrane-fusion protein)
MELEAKLAAATAELAALKAKAGEANKQDEVLAKLQKAQAGLKKQLLGKAASQIARQEGLVDEAVLSLVDFSDAYGEDESLDEAKVAAKIAEHKKAHPKLYSEPASFGEPGDYIPALVDIQGTRGGEGTGQYAGLVRSGAITADQAKALRATMKPGGATDVRKHAAMLAAKK